MTAWEFQDHSSKRVALIDPEYVTTAIDEAGWLPEHIYDKYNEEAESLERRQEDGYSSKILFEIIYFESLL